MRDRVRGERQAAGESPCQPTQLPATPVVPHDRVQRRFALAEPSASDLPPQIKVCGVTTVEEGRQARRSRCPALTVAS